MSIINLQNFKITQLGYLYRNIKDKARELETELEMPKFGFFENNGVPFKYRGNDTEIWTKIAISRGLNKQIELIQWIDGDCIFKEFINSGREGLHHFGIFVDDFQPIRVYFSKKGFEVVHEGIAGIYHVAYIDTFDSLGVYLEFQEPAKKKRSKRK